MGTIRETDWESPYYVDDLPEVTAKICFVRIGEEDFIELKTLGPSDEMYDPDILQVLRLSKRTIETMASLMKTFSKDA